MELVIFGRKSHNQNVFGRRSCRWVDELKMDLQDTRCTGSGNVVTNLRVT